MDSPAMLYRSPRFIAGLDVGQMNDPSALTVLERDMRLVHGQLEPYFFCGYLDRLPLQTPYPIMGRMVREKLERFGEKCLLVIDATGVGRAVVDEFRQAWTYYDEVSQAMLPRRDKPTIVALTIVHAERPIIKQWDDIHVSKLDLVMTLMLVMERHRLDVAKGLEQFPHLIREAQEFQWKKTTREMDDPYSQWRQGKQDDMLLAVAIAVWWGERYAPRTAPGQQQQYATGARNPLLRASGGRR